MYFYLGRNKKSYHGVNKTDAAKNSPCRIDVTFNENCTGLVVHNVHRKGTLDEMWTTLHDVIWYGKTKTKSVTHVSIHTKKFPEAFLRRHGFEKINNVYMLKF